MRASSQDPVYRQRFSAWENSWPQEVFDKNNIDLCLPNPNFGRCSLVEISAIPPNQDIHRGPNIHPKIGWEDIAYLKGSGRGAIYGVTPNHRQIPLFNRGQEGISGFVRGNELVDSKFLDWSRKGRPCGSWLLLSKLWLFPTEIGDLRPDTNLYECVHFRSAIVTSALQ